MLRKTLAAFVLIATAAAATQATVYSDHEITGWDGDTSFITKPKSWPKLDSMIEVTEDQLGEILADTGGAPIGFDCNYEDADNDGTAEWFEIVQ